MKVFISSLIAGMEDLRAAAREAVTHLGHSPVMAEDFVAQPNSPQVACLSGLRQSNLMVLILGARYGATQPSGLSATHEEYREAKDSRPVLIFVQEGADLEPRQKAFVDEVQAWQSGYFRSGFSSARQLAGAITRSIHEWELANATAPVNEGQLIRQCMDALDNQKAESHHSDSALMLSVTPGPSQALIRPAQLEKADFQEELLKISLFGNGRLFSAAKPTEVNIKDHALHLSNDKGRSFVTIDSKAQVLIQLALDNAGHGMVIIEEDIIQSLLQALRFSALVFDFVDATQRLTHIALATSITGNRHRTWRTRAEQDASPNSYSMGFSNEDSKPVHLEPPVRPRAALVHEQNNIVEDLVTLLRRQLKTR